MDIHKNSTLYDDYAQLVAETCGLSAVFIVLQGNDHFSLLGHACAADEKMVFFPSRPPANHPILARLISLAGSEPSWRRLDQENIFRSHAGRPFMARFSMCCVMALDGSEGSPTGAIIGFNSTLRPDTLSVTEQNVLHLTVRLLRHTLAVQSQPPPEQATVNQNIAHHIPSDIQLAFANNPSGLVILEKGSGRLLRANQAADKLFELGNRHFLPDAPTVFSSLVQRAILHGVGCTRQWVEHQSHSGNSIAFFVLIKVLHDENHIPSLVLLIVEKEFAPEIFPQQDYYKSLLQQHMMEITTQPVWISDGNGRIIYLNRFWQDFTGISVTSNHDEKDIDLRPLWEMAFHPEYLAKIVHHRETAFNDGMHYDIEVPMRRVDGEYRWFLIRSISLHCDRTPKLWVGIGTDIHDRIKADHELRTIMNTMPQMIWSAQADGYHDFFNQRWIQFSGLPTNQLIGHGWTTLLHPDDRDDTLAHMNNSIASGQSYEIEHRMKRVDGQWRWILTQAHAISNEETGAVTRWYGSCTDIEHSVQAREILKRDASALETLVQQRTLALQKALRENTETQEQLRQAQKMEAVGQLTGGIAHDFNNILACIIGNLELLQIKTQKNDTSETEKYIQSALNAADKASSLIDRLLSFSRRQPLNSSSVNINSLIVGLDDLLSRTLGASIHVITELQSDLWLTLCDPHQLDNAVLNLAINARDAMPDGGSLQITTCNFRNDPDQPDNYMSILPTGDYICVTVKDSGTGMSPDVMGRAFEPFFTTKRLVGTGLGLSMVYGFVKQTGGHISIDSRPGSGTTVSIYLPRLLDQD
ncbi:Sensory transduction protein kinase [Granulibacter bethesdensis]|nr:Sensory transduction protein kinase [Granulibacter bethesdensis]